MSLEQTNFTAQDVANILNAVRSGDSRSKDFVPPHGQVGLFNVPGIRPEVYDLTPNVGTMSAMLPMYPSRNQMERFEFVTGITAQTGTNPATTCGTPPQSGNMKVGDINIYYGKFYKGLQVMDVSEAGQYYSRAEIDRRIINPNQMTNPFVPQPTGGANYNTWLGKQFIEFGQGAQLDFAYVDWQGNFANQGVAAQLGFMREYNGIDQFVRTGWRDAISGNLLTSLDSNIVNYNAAMSSVIVSNLTRMIRTLRYQGAMKRTPNAQYIIAVHPTMRDPLIDIWACNYATYACNTDVNAAVRVDAQYITSLRDQMRGGGYLLIDGVQFPLVTDAGIGASLNQTTGLWTSDIYVLPLNDGNGNNLLYREYLPYDGINPDVTEIVSMTTGKYRVLNNGMYMMKWDDSAGGFCINYSFTGKFRLILERPDLAGKIDNVTYAATTTYLDPFPGTTYHRDGGRQLYGVTY